MSRTSFVRLGGAIVAACLSLACVPAAAQRPVPVAREAQGDLVVLSGPATVRAGESVRSLGVLEGPTRIDGAVQGDLVAVGGDVDVTGRVDGDVLAASGIVRLHPGARVSGDVLTSQPTVVPAGAVVGGDILPLGGGASTGARVLGQLASWLAVTASSFLLALLLAVLLPATTGEAIYRAAREAPARALGIGLITALALPVLAMLAMLTLVGLPLGLSVLAATLLLSCVGYVTAGWLLGRRLAETTRVSEWPRIAWLCVGLGILRLVSLVPIVSILVWVLASSLGVGALIVALLRYRAGAPAVPTPPHVLRPGEENPVATRGSPRVESALPSPSPVRDSPAPEANHDGVPRALGTRASRSTDRSRRSRPASRSPARPAHASARSSTA